MALMVSFSCFKPLGEPEHHWTSSSAHRTSSSARALSSLPASTRCSLMSPSPHHPLSIGDHAQIFPQFKGLFHDDEYKLKKIEELPSRVDWREEGVVSAVRHQGNCGCCWAIAAVAAMEAIIKIKTGRLTQLSVQELIDCDEEGNAKGGHVITAFLYVLTHGGIHKERDYPTRMKQGICRLPRHKTKESAITGLSMVTPYDEESFIKALAHQPICLTINANCMAFTKYKGGIFRGPYFWERFLPSCSPFLQNHAMIAVGYGNDEKTGEAYIRVQNSWGKDWGEDGYARIARSNGRPEGVCGIFNNIAYPRIDS